MAAEENADVNWLEVKRLCSRTLKTLKEQPAPDYTDQFVYVYLEDPELRQEDPDYARVQRERLRNWFEGSRIISR